MSLRNKLRHHNLKVKLNIINKANNSVVEELFPAGVSQACFELPVGTKGLIFRQLGVELLSDMLKKKKKKKRQSCIVTFYLAYPGAHLSSSSRPQFSFKKWNSQVQAEHFGHSA